ncbi:hypothetical protein CVT25_010710 [Psilocybe cyanescens]|uniref:Uncharacterized protein n=1 Tax=Psilocybe cyanescens TaxID=93625 RepID=A0A409WJM4_PSICY|nr:hypothetical protein CVT25_010710 [Psilocybe cyanescens]
MKFATSAVFFSFAGLAASASITRRNCVEAARFGALSAFPVTVSPGDTINISVNLNCAVEQFGIVPQFLDYTLEVPEASNNGSEQPIVLARRTFNISPGTNQPSDSFSTQVPRGFFVAGAPYNVVLNMVYPISGTDGSTVLVKGSTSIPININA